MTEKDTKEVETKNEEEDIERSSFSFDIEAGKPHRLDFSKAPKPEEGELILALVILVARNESDDKGPITVKVTYKDLESYEGDLNSKPVVTKEDVVCTIEEGDHEQKDVNYRFYDEHEATFSVEGNGSVNIVGCFVPDSGEEEEEEEAAEKQE